LFTFNLWFTVVLNSTASRTCHESFPLRRLSSNYSLDGVKGLGKFCTNNIATQKFLNKELGENQQVISFKNSLDKTAL